MTDRAVIPLPTDPPPAAAAPDAPGVAGPVGFPHNDLGQDYLAERARAETVEADPDAWFDRYRIAAPAGGGQPNEPAPKPPAGADTGGAASPGGDIPSTDSAAPPALQPYQLWLAAYAAPGMEVMGYPGPLARAARALASGVGAGALEAPGAAVRGAAGAVGNTAATADALVWQPFRDFSDWLNDRGVNTKVPVPDWLSPSVIAGLEQPALVVAAGAEGVRDFIGERRTVIGKLTEFTAQWLTSSAIGGKVAQALGLPANVYTAIVRDGLAGAIGFDPKQERLSNLIQNAAPNPLTEWLQADSDDPEILARLKAGLETAGLRAISEGVIRGLRFLRARAVSATPDGGGRAGVPEPDNALGGGKADRVGEAAKAAPPVVVNDNFSKDALRFLAGEIPDAPIQVNLGRFEGGAAIRRTIADLARLLPAPERISNETTLRLARELGLSPEQAMSSLGGNLADKQRIAAGWMLFRSAAGQVQRLGEQAARTGATADVARFDAAFQTAFAVLRTVKGQSAEIARALQIHNALRTETPEAVKALEALIEQAGGRQVGLEIAAKVAGLMDPAQVARFINEAGRATTRDKIVFAYANALLSNPASHVVNVADTSLATLMQVPETWVASKIGGHVPAGEAAARLLGMVESYKTGLRLAARTLRTGESQFAAAQRLDLPSGLVTAQDLAAGGGRRFGDYLAMALPTRWMMAGDELTKAAAYRGEAAALAWRDAAATRGLTGEAARAHAARLLNEMPDWLREAAEASAIKSTFNEPLAGVAQSLAQSVDRMNVANVPVGRILVATFVRTPVNILRWVTHRTPAAFLSPQIQAEIAAGGASRDLALARIATGSAVMGTFADLTLQGRITGAGPKDPALRAALMRPDADGRVHWQPYSIKLGERWVSYNRSGTVGALIGISADAVELMSGVYGRDKATVSIDGEPVEDTVAAAVTLPFAGAILNKTYMQQLSGLIEALQDPQRYGEGWIQRIAGSAVPAGAAAAERAIDPELRRAESWLDAVRARVPGLSTGSETLGLEPLMPRLTLWGDPVKDQNGIWNLFLPARQAKAGGWPVDAELARLGLGLNPPPQTQSFSLGTVAVPVRLDAEAHNRLIALAGNELKLQPDGAGTPRYGAREYLDATLAGKTRISGEWARASDEKRELIIRDVVTRYRQAAKAQLLRDSPELLELVQGQAREKAAAITSPRPAAVPASPGAAASGRTAPAMPQLQ